MIDYAGTHLPSDPPPYAVPPYLYQNNEMFTITIRTDREVLRALAREIGPGEEPGRVLEAKAHLEDECEIGLGLRGGLASVQYRIALHRTRAQSAQATISIGLIARRHD